MKIEQTSPNGIRLNVELTEDERITIKRDLEENMVKITNATNRSTTDDFLRELRNEL